MLSCRNFDGWFHYAKTSVFTEFPYNLVIFHYLQAFVVAANTLEEFSGYIKRLVSSPKNH